VRDDAEVPDVAKLSHRSPRSRLAYRTGAARGDTLWRAWGRWYTRPSMANIKSQIKRDRQNEKRRKRNQGVRSSLKTATKRATTAAESGDADAATAALGEASRAYDKAASKGMLHRRAAARHKSRLAKAANRAAASAE
jgi:small subunit ribosomal protein S20